MDRGDEVSVPLAGHMVTRLVIDDAMTLECRNRDGITAALRIEGEIEYAANGQTVTGSVDADPTVLGPLLGLVYRRIDSARVLDDGSLELGLGVDATLRVRSAEHFMGWEVKMNDLHVICLAEGAVVVSPPA